MKSKLKDDREPLAMLYQFPHWHDRSSQSSFVGWSTNPVLQKNIEFIDRTKTIFNDIPQKNVPVLMRLFVDYVQSQTNSIEEQVIKENPQLPINSRRLKDKLKQKLYPLVKPLPRSFQPEFCEDLIAHHLLVWLYRLSFIKSRQLWKESNWLSKDTQNLLEDFRMAGLSVCSNPYVFFTNFETQEVDYDRYYSHLKAYSSTSIWGKIIDYMSDKTRLGDDFKRSDLSLVDRASNTDIMDALSYAGQGQNVEIQLSLAKVFEEVKEAGKIDIKQRQNIEQYQVIIDRYKQLYNSSLPYTPEQVKQILESIGKAIRKYKKRVFSATSLNVDLDKEEKGNTLIDTIADTSQSNQIEAEYDDRNDNNKWTLSPKQKQIKPILVEQLEAFKPQTQNIFVLLFWLDMKQEEIALEVGKHQSNISKPKKKLLLNCIEALQKEGFVTTNDAQTLKNWKKSIEYFFTKYYNSCFYLN